MELFKKRLKELIESTNKKQVQICKEMNIKKQVLTNWKTGYSEPNLNDLIMIADYFDVSVDYLLGYENDDGTKNINIKNSFNHNKGNIFFNNK